LRSITTALNIFVNLTAARHCVSSYKFFS
jgi:hypothetical protein